MKWSSAVAIGLAFVFAGTDTASAQLLGPLRWQFAPFCNVVTLMVEQKGVVFDITGTDDGCNGAAPAATVNGSAHLNAGGNVGMSLTIVRPDAFVISATIDLNLATLSGAWKDNWSNSGTFTFNPVLPVAAPPRRLTMRGEWSVSFVAANGNNGGLSSFSFPQALPSAPGADLGNVIPVGGPSTTNCPGTVTDPQALPGQLCVYEKIRGNTDIVRILDNGSAQFERASPTGFSIVNSAAAAGDSFAHGRWAVTVP